MGVTPHSGWMVWCLVFCRNDWISHQLWGRWPSTIWLDAEIAMNAIAGISQLAPEHWIWYLFWKLNQIGDYSCWLLFQMHSGGANLSMGAIPRSLGHSSKFTASFPYAYANLYFAIPKGTPHSSSEKMFEPFDRIVWTILCTSFVVSFAFFMYLRFRVSPRVRSLIVGSQNRTPFLNMLNIFFGGPVTIIPRTFTARKLLVIWLFMSLVLRTGYQGHLFDFLQSDMIHPPVNTIKKLNHTQFTIYSTALLYDKVKKIMPKGR